MEAIAQYLLRIVCASLIGSILLSVTGRSGPSWRIRQMLCGLFVMATALAPLRELDLKQFALSDFVLSPDGSRYVQTGEEQARNAVAEIISGHMRAYILTKAGELGLEPDLCVTLDPETGIPVGVEITCSAAPYEKSILCDYIQDTLGIERSAIRWNP